MGRVCVCVSMCVYAGGGRELGIVRRAGVCVFGVWATTALSDKSAMDLQHIPKTSNDSCVVSYLQDLVGELHAPVRELERAFAGLGQNAQEDRVEGDDARLLLFGWGCCGCERKDGTVGGEKEGGSVCVCF